MVSDCPGNRCKIFKRALLPPERVPVGKQAELKRLCRLPKNLKGSIQTLISLLSVAFVATSCHHNHSWALNVCMLLKSLFSGVILRS